MVARGEVRWLELEEEGRRPVVEGHEGPPATAYAAPEAHNAEYDQSGRLLAMTLVNVRWLLDREGELTITWRASHVTADELAVALAPGT